jgi:hypothetical protein
MVGLQVFGFGDTLRLYELDRDTGLWVRGFRPLQLDDLLGWSQGVAREQHWDMEALQRQVIDFWLTHAAQIQTWQASLQGLPHDHSLVAALGSHREWGRHMERLLRA